MKRHVGVSPLRSARTERTSFSFAGCGFVGLYHIGMYMGLQEHAKEYVSRLTAWYGASAGSMISVAAACDIRATEGYKFIRKLHEEVHKHKMLGKFGAFHPSFDLTGYVRTFLERILPRDAHRRCRNKVGISLTVLPSMTNWIVSDFNTRAELIQAVVCSCYLPVIAGINPPQFRGKTCCDGGLTNNLPFSTDPNVITVSPFSGECDICPNGDTETHLLAFVCGQAIQASWKNMKRGFGAMVFFSWQEMDEVCARGFRDAYNFIKREGIQLTDLMSPVPMATQALPTNMLDNDNTSEYYSRNHSRQSSSVGCLDQLLDELEERRDSAILFVEEEASENGDDDSGIYFKPSKKFQLRWTLKSKALLQNGSSVVSSVSNKWHCFMETISEYQHDVKMWQFLGQSGPDTTSTTPPFLPLAVTS